MITYKTIKKILIPYIKIKQFREGYNQKSIQFILKKNFDCRLINLSKLIDEKFD